jgi:diguanylate cyclase (GGDEF)-like protein/PAS domain S-box-containing protein
VPAIPINPSGPPDIASQPADAAGLIQAAEPPAPPTGLPAPAHTGPDSRQHQSESPGASPAQDPLRGLLWLVTLMLGLGVLTLLVVVAFFAREQDRAAVNSSMAVARSALEVRQSELSRIVRDIAWNDEAVAKLVLTIDPAWAEATIGPIQVQNNSIDASFVVDGTDRTIMAFVHGHPARADAFRALSGGLDELLAYSRGSPRYTSRAAAGFLTFEGTPHLVVASAITPEPDSTPWPYGVPKSVIVLARPLDPAFLGRLGNDFHIDDLRLVRTKNSALGAALPLNSPDGPPVGTLTWSPDQPARKLVIGTGPIAGVIAAAMIVLYWLFLRRSRRVGVVLARQARIIEHVHEGLILTDSFGIIGGWNAGSERTFGYTRAEVIGRSAAMLLATSDAADEVGTIVRSFDGGRESADLELLMRRKNGESFPVQLLLSPIKDANGRAVGTIGYHVDISERKKLEDRLERLATVDELTTAYNRRYLLSHGPIEMERARRFKRQLSFLFIDLDHFKSVNDRFGHGFGDLVLSTFAQTCRSVLRPPDMFVRYGGEEFVVVMPETSEEQAVAVAARLSDHVRETLFSTDPPFQGLTISVGATTLRDSDKGIEEILDRADKAVYRAKELGRDRIELAA